MSSNLQPANMSYVVANGASSSNPYVEIFEARAPTANDVNYPIQKRWFNTNTNVESILIGYTSYGGLLQAIWVNSSVAEALLSFLGGTNTTGTFPVDPSSLGSITLSSNNGSVVITGGVNSLDFSATGTGFPWSNVTSATQTLHINNGYITDFSAGVTYTLPLTASQGNIIRIAGFSGLWTIDQNAAQTINFGSSTTTTGTGGSVSATNVNDAIELLCVVSGTSTVWTTLSSVGNLTVT